MTLTAAQRRILVAAAAHKVGRIVGGDPRTRAILIDRGYIERDGYNYGPLFKHRCRSRGGALVTRFLFVGEARSRTAQDRGWTWADGHLAAKPLHDALRSMGMDPADHAFTNLFADQEDGSTLAKIRRRGLATVRAHAGVVVALGRKVAVALSELGIDHVALVHPAARGRIRKASRYRAHVRRALTTPLRPTRSAHRQS